ncbi:MAG: hypothetical protein ACI4XB_04840 [Ruminococcus sp.]
MVRSLTMRRNTSVCGILLLLILCVCFASEIRSEMQNALNRCLTVIIPSLYAMMILSQLLVTTGIWRVLARPLRRITPKLFGMPDACFAIFLLSQFAGYPVGASMLRILTENGTLRREDAGRLLWVCYGGGPAFLLGLLGNVPHRNQVFLLIFSANVLSNLLLACLLFRRHPVQLRQNEQVAIRPADASLLVRCTVDAGQTLLKLCGIILCFSAVCGILDALGLFQLLTLSAQKISLDIPISTVTKSILEITNAAALSLPFRIRIPVFAALLSFGGFCVILQIRAVAGDVVPMKHFIAWRCAAAVFSAVCCAVGMHFLPDIPDETTAVVSTAIVSRNPIFPTCMLLVMILLVFREAQKLD